MHNGNLDFVNGKLAAQTLFSEALAASSPSPPPQLPKNKNSSEMLALTHTFNSLFFGKKERKKGRRGGREKERKEKKEGKN